MKEIHSFNEWQSILNESRELLLFVKTNHCSVCEGLYPQVAALQESYAFPFYRVNASEVPELAGQLELFTAPVVLLFHQQREMARFARIIPMNDLTRRLDDLEEWRKAEDA